ncbi:unnamed protein product [Mycena citricolor]|uniref:DUF6535 domain-containing protein n=1 Tax=Mycena citricolor TaxID=2018698 RepID=A0AAD2GVJ9_9AGAR|nr:unnamed protein product [Mycena citricolor]
MPRAEQRQTNQRDADDAFSEREKAIGNKLWGVYITEAEKYDQGLIDGWRSEMDGLLIFAGLFSGVVTTFIIDSYKTLNPDSGSQTVVSLNQISQQLANINNSTAGMDALSPTAPFSPPASALVCNALWFASLALSLSSALVATLVEQWAREYQHRTSMFSSISIRSRVYMYLYYGLQRFNMHTIVGIPPLLLHASLVLFLAGLVAFLVPVNVIIMSISSALLGLFVFVYLLFTVLPLFFLDCPYQTPLTRILWPLKQSMASMLTASVQRAAAAWKAFLQRSIAVPDPEKAAEPTVTNPDASTEPFTAEDTLLQPQSMVDAMKSEALRSTVKTETRALAWTVRSLSDDQELEPFVEGLPQVLWDFEHSKPRRVYQALFQSLLRDPEIHLCQRLGDFMVGSTSNLLEDKVRVRRQLSVLRAIWAICAFSLHTGSPLQSPIGEADVDSALLGTKFLNSPDVQSMVPAVTALIHLNVIDSRGRDGASTQARSSDGHLGAEAHADMHDAYTRYLMAFSQCAATFQRDVTVSLFDPPQLRCTEAGYWILQDALEKLIDSALDKTADETADNVVFAARQMISLFAQTSEYPVWWLPGLGPFLVRHSTLVGSDPKFDAEHDYTRFLCHKLCDNLKDKDKPQESVDALQLIYRNLLESDEPPRDLDTHLLVLYTLRTKAADIRTYHLAAIVQCVVLKYLRRDPSKLEQLPSMFDDEDWFRSVLGLENDEPTEQVSTLQISECVRVGAMTAFFEQCAARSPDQTERDLDLETFKVVRHAHMVIFLAIPIKLQRRFANAAAGFIRKYPENCLANRDGLFSVLVWAVAGGGFIREDGYITDLDALRVLDTAVSEMQTDDQQQDHRDNAQRIRERMQDRLRPKNISAEYVPLVSDGE